MKSPRSSNFRTQTQPLLKITLAAVLLTLAACGEPTVTITGVGSNSSNDNDTSDTGTSLPDSSNPESSNTDSNSEPQGGGDDFWAELAQEYEPFVKPPGLGAAEPTDWISIGRWDDTFDWPIIATGAANMPDGRIVAWSSQQVDAFGGTEESTHGTIFNPVDDSFTSTPNSTHDMFCAGISLLEDGRIFVAGGGKTVSTASIFDTDQFTEIDSMAISRWYPTSTTLASGQVFTSLGTTGTPYPEIWTDGKGWSLLPNISLQTILDDEDVVHNDWYPALNVAPDGSLFHPGHMQGVLSIYMNDEDSVHEHGDRTTDEESRLYNTTVMYDIGKMLIAGGGSGENATNTAMTMDVNGIQPVITPTNSMKHVRSMQNSVVLPNGEVLVIGGNTSGIQFSDAGTVLEPEMWNPVTEQWRTLALHDKPRNYHSVALLMKDARVLVAGGGLCGGCATNHQDGEIYSPPYLFDENGSAVVRPTISSGDAAALPGDTISIIATDDIVEFNMLRLVAITHHHTTDQRFVPIDSVKTNTGQFELTLNANPNVLLPGYYWIFGIDQNGIPTEGHTIHIAVTPENQPDTSLDTSPNVEYEYYEENWAQWVLPDFDSLTPVKTGTQSDFSLAAKESNNRYAFRFRASLQVPVDGEYTFYLSSDDGSKLLLDDQVIVDHDGAHGFEIEENGTANLFAGSYDIEVQFFEVTGGDALLVSWEGPQTDKQPIQAIHLGSPLESQAFDNTNPGPELTGLVSYRYYEGTWTSLPDFTNETIIKEGEIEGFDLSPRLINDYYGFEFTANLTIPENGDYTFYTTSDDGSRLSIDGITVVNNDGLHPAVQQSGTISLTAGTYRLTVDYFEYAGGDSLTVEWDGPGFNQQAIPLSALTSNGSIDDGSGIDADTDTDTGTETETETEVEPGTLGLVNYQYYEGSWSNLPDFSTITPVKQGETAGFVLTDRINDDFYAMQFTAKLIIPTAGTYTLYAQSDDGSRIYINGQLVVDNDGLHASIEKQGDITLSAGEHDIIVQFFEYDRGDNLTVSWAGPNIQKQEIPLSALATGSVATDEADEADEIDPTDTADEADPTDTTDTTTVTGTLGMINYEYFEGSWTSIPNFDSLVPVAQGEQASFSLAPKQIDDNYGFRFAAYIEVPADGIYTFYIASDDGSRLHINGQLLVDNDGLHASREYNASQYLTAGTHHVLVEYFERTGQDTLDVSWSATSMAKQLLQNATLSAAPFDYTETDIPITSSATTGVNFEYFEGTWETLPDFDLLTPVSTGELDQFTLPASNGELFYGYRFTGQIQIDEAGLYTFYTLSNDGSQLHINDNLIVDNDGRHGATEAQGAVTLSAGLHNITVTYFQSGGTEALDVYWSSANKAKQIIDSSVLFTP